MKLSIFPKDDITMMVEMIRKKMNGAVDEKEWGSFRAWVNDATKYDQTTKCRNCLDKGYLWKDKQLYTWVYRCSCEIGQTKDANVPFWTEPFRPITKAIIYE